MEGRRLGILGVLFCTALAGSWLAVADEPGAGGSAAANVDIEDYGDAASTTPVFTAESGPAVVSPERLPRFPVPPDVEIPTYYVNADGTERVLSDGVVAGGFEHPIYSNPLGRTAVSPGAQVLIADDVTTTAPNNCQMTRFAFEVTGKVNPAGFGGPYSVTWAMYSTCPGAVSASVVNNRIIGGTVGSMNFATDAPARIEVVVFGVPIPTSFWLGLKFSRDNAGPLLGTPAQKGFTADAFQLSGAQPCISNFGGFPQQIYAGFNIEVWGEDAGSCAETNVAYSARNEAGSVFNPGTSISLVDDLALLTPNCRLVGYEVAVRGTGRFDFEFRNFCDSAAISGTARFGLISPSAGSDTRTLRFAIDPPVALPQNVWFAAKVNNQSGGVVLSGDDPQVGTTADIFGVQPPTPPADPPAACTVEDTVAGQEDAMNVTVICEGEPPVGACCDMFVPQCTGGPVVGGACRSNADCNSPATCEVRCRQLPQLNCTFPPAETELRPLWQQAQACSPNTFPEGTCGTSACCHLNAQGVDVCDNLTRNQCDAQVPLPPEPRQWQTGRFCGVINQRCPLHACLGKDGDCKQPQPHPGCDDPECCTDVCVLDDPFCCTSVWDNICAEVANEICSGAPVNDECFSARGGARLITVGDTYTDDGDSATIGDNDPQICCHNLMPRVCLFGTTGEPCTTDEDCGLGGICGDRPPIGRATLWYRFVAPAGGIVGIDTCASSPPATDSVIQVFEPGDRTSLDTSCATLAPIACGDDTPGCSSSGKNARVCVGGLTPGLEYFIMIGAKTPDTEDNYRLTLTTGCTPPSGTAANDFCLSGTPVSDGARAFNLATSTLDCPADLCAPAMEHDVWFNYTATCTGTATATTCGPTATEPPTNIVAYKGCNRCPPAAETLACSDPGACGSVEFGVVSGECYKVRVGDDAGNMPSGQLNISCEVGCFPGSVTFLEPPNGVVDARRPFDPLTGDPPLGVQEIRVQGPQGVELAPCWRVDCETAFTGEVPNEIERVTEESPGTYIVRLTQPITVNAFTRIRYLGNPIGDNASAVRMTSHPANVDGDFAAFSGDIVALRDELNATGAPLPWGANSSDVDRSGRTTPLDLLDAVDLMNGAEFYEPVLNEPLPPSTPCACTLGAQCESGFCADGVCCDTSCTATCVACTTAKKGGGADGTCGNVAAGMDPDSECSGATPNCNGAGACGP